MLEKHWNDIRHQVTAGGAPTVCVVMGLLAREAFLLAQVGPQFFIVLFSVQDYGLFLNIACLFRISIVKFTVLYFGNKCFRWRGPRSLGCRMGLWKPSGRCMKSNCCKCYLYIYKFKSLLKQFVLFQPNELIISLT